MGGESCDEGGGVFADQDEVEVLWAEEFFFDGVTEESQDGVEIAVDIEQTDGFLVNTEYGPGDNFEEFLECADSARQGQKAAGQFGHSGLSLVHGVDDFELGDLIMGEFFGHEHVGDDADDLSTACEDGIGDNSHEADFAASIDEAHSLAGDFVAYGIGCDGVELAGSGLASAEDAEEFGIRIRLEFHRYGPAFKDWYLRRWSRRAEFVSKSSATLMPRLSYDGMRGINAI